MNYKERKILILDDEKQIVDIVEKALIREGFSRIYKSYSIEQAFAMVNEKRPDLLILDVMLPDGSGFDLINRVRRSNNIPVIFLTAKDEDTDKLIGLGLGADDYVTKPFVTKELILRIEAILRRTYNFEAKESIKFKLGKIWVDIDKNVVINEGEESCH